MHPAELQVEQQTTVMRLRIAGADYPQIAAQLGITKQMARKLHVAALREVHSETLEEARKMQIERTNAMILALWPRVKQGNIPAIKVVLQILFRQARLLGLDAPERVEVLSVDTVTAEIQRLEAELGSGGTPAGALPAPGPAD